MIAAISDFHMLAASLCLTALHLNERSWDVCVIRGPHSPAYCVGVGLGVGVGVSGGRGG